jgi:uncharacterized protein YehS (DUF1456 family)
MILKNADDKSKRINKLQELLSKSDKKLSRRIEQEMRIVRAEIRRDKDASELIGLYFDRIENAVVLHDLRIEINQKIAHIDHLIISGNNRFYVLNTRYFTHGLRSNDRGDYLRWCEWRKSFDVTPSPIEANARNVDVLIEALAFIGLSKVSAVVPFVVVSPDAIIGQSLASRAQGVIRLSQFVSAYEDDLAAIAQDNFSAISDALMVEGRAASASEIASMLLAMHKPLDIDYEAKFAPPVEEGFKRRASDVAHLTSVGQQEASLGSDVTKLNPACARCSSSKLRVEYGRYGFYFNCKACDANKLIKIECDMPGHTEVLRKEGSKYYRECGQCKSSSLYFENVV